MLFLGNAGTGKTTVAKVLAKLLHVLGVVPENKFMEYDNAKTALVAAVVGETSQKAAKVFMDAKGGVLFLDEAYSLVPTSPEDFAHEAIGELLSKSEEYRADLVIILAGYEKWGSC